MKVSLGVLITVASMAFFLPENAQALMPIENKGSVETAISNGQREAIPVEMQAQADSFAAPLIVDPKNYDPPPLPKPRVEDPIDPDIDGDGRPDIVPEPPPGEE